MPMPARNFTAVRTKRKSDRTKDAPFGRGRLLKWGVGLPSLQENGYVTTDDDKASPCGALLTPVIRSSSRIWDVVTSMHPTSCLPIYLDSSVMKLISDRTS